MPEIDEELGRYLDSLVEPVEPEWVIGWVARRRRRRAAVVASGAVVLAGVAGSLGYALHSPSSGSVRFGTEVPRSTTEAPSTSAAVPSSSSSTSLATAPHSPPPTAGVTTTTSPYPWPTKVYSPGDLTATVEFATSPLVVGQPVEVTAAITNTTDSGVLLPLYATDVAVFMSYSAQDADQPVYWAAIPMAQRFPEDVIMGGFFFPPHATLTATATYTPWRSGTGTAGVYGIEHQVPTTPSLLASPMTVDIVDAPDTTTTTTTTGP